MEEQRGESGVAAGAECGDARIGGRLVFGGITVEAERDAVEEGLIVFEVGGAEGGVGLRGGFAQVVRGPQGRIETFAAGAFERAVKTAGGRDKDGGLGRTLDAYSVGIRDDFTIGADGEAGLEEHAFAVEVGAVEDLGGVGFAGGVGIEILRVFVLVAPLLDDLEIAATDIAGELAAEDEFAGRGGRLGRGMDGRERGFEREGAGFVGAQAEGDHLVGGAGDDLAGEGGAVALEAHAGGGGGEVEPTAVSRDGPGAGEIEPEIAERLVTRLVAAKPVFGDVGIGLGVFAGLDERGDVAEVLRDVHGAEIGGRLAGGEGVFVELELLAEWAAVNHGGETAVADRQGVGPALGGLVIPKRERVAGSGEGGGRERGGEGEEDKGGGAAE